MKNMHIIDIYKHPVHGRAYLWSPAGYKYHLGTVDTKYMDFDGFTLDEVTTKIKKNGFVRVEQRLDS